MSDSGKIESLQNHRRKARKSKAKGNTLCKRGFHKWESIDSNPFDVKKGKLVTGYRCARCGAHKASAK